MFCAEPIKHLFTFCVCVAKQSCCNFYVTLFRCLYSRSHALKAKSSDPMAVREFWQLFRKGINLTASVLVLSDHSTWSHLRPEWCICLVTLFSKFHSLLVVFQFKVSSRLMTFNWTLELRFRTVFGMKPKCKVEVLDGSLVVPALKDCNSEVFSFLSYVLKTKTRHLIPKWPPFYMVGHPFQNYDIVYVRFFAAYNRL